MRRVEECDGAGLLKQLSQRRGIRLVTGAERLVGAMPIVRIDAGRIRDWEDFHSVFAQELGFPAFYGRNMNAWVDCMTSLDDPGSGLTTVRGAADDPVVLRLDDVDAMPAEIYQALVESAGFVNWRRMEAGEPAILVLAFWRRG